MNRIVNFVSYESELSMYGTSYDYESITHYPAQAFSRNGKPTIVSNEPDGAKIMVNHQIHFNQHIP